MYICLCCYLKSLAEKKAKMREDVARLEAEMEQLRSTHEVSVEICFLHNFISGFHFYTNCGRVRPAGWTL